MDPHGQHGVDALNLQGNLDNLKVSATDVASHHSCPRYLALKIRPDVRSSAWQRRYGSADTLVLGSIDQLVQVALQDNVADQPANLPAWIRQQLDARGTHRLLRPYVETAVENLLDAHFEIVREVGELKLIGSDPFIGRPPRVLWVWAPMYGTEFGDVEYDAIESARPTIRQLRTTCCGPRQRRELQPAHEGDRPNSRTRHRGGGG